MGVFVLRKLLTVFFSISFMLCFTACNNAREIEPEVQSINRTMREAFLPTVNIGDYISIGSFNGEEILWRCVDSDENGKLMLSDKIIALMPYDVAGTDNSASHVRANGKQRQKFGSDYWFDSNIRSWLNSEKDSDKIDWICKNPPDSSQTSDGRNAYSGLNGFLHSDNFSDKQKKAIKEVTLYSAMNSLEYTYPKPDSNSLPDYGYVVDTPDFVDYYYGEEAKEKIFLPDIFQIKHIYNNSLVLGEGYYIGRPTATAVKKAVKDKMISPERSWHTATRTPSCNNTETTYIYCVYSEDGLYEELYAYTSYIGIRPAFYLDEANAFCVAGDGTLSDPYYIK